LVQEHANYLWTLMAAALVFIMQAGFAMVETGFTRAKNACNIMMKNLMDFSVGSIAFWAVGFGLMFGTSTGWFGTTGFFFSDFTGDDAPWNFGLLDVPGGLCRDGGHHHLGGGSRADQVQAYLVYSALVSAVIYPISGSWAWGSLFQWRRLAGKPGLHRFCRVHGGALRGRLGWLWPAPSSRSSSRQIRQGRPGQADSRS
jgi:ammonium transporter, Amt family